MTEDDLRAAHVGPLRPLNDRVQLVPYDRRWPDAFAHESDRIRQALGEGARRIEHIGSTSVPGLAAKPVIDILLVVDDSSREEVYVPALEAAGFALHIREPGWYEHRMFKRPGASINLHVFSDGCPEVARVITFRDWLRRNDADRELYERTKYELAARTWQYTQHYADAKTDVVQEILGRASSSRPADR